LAVDFSLNLYLTPVISDKDRDFGGSMFENVIVGKVVLLGVKEFHGLHDDLKII